MTKILVVGAGGMLGRDLMSELRGLDVVGLTKQDLDVRRSAHVAAAVRGFDVVINAAAYTKVDDAEVNGELAFAVNAKGAENLARATAAAKTHLVHISTDYVFDGFAQSPYAEDATTNPLSVYGQSKSDGETAVMEANTRFSIVRTSWLYGEHGPNFPKTMARLGLEREFLEVVDDQIGQPTSTIDVARMIRALIQSENPTGVFHATNSGATSWWKFAQVLFEKAGWDPGRIHPISSTEFVRPAPRPGWSVLGHERWKACGLEAPRPWEEALEEAWVRYLKGVFEEHRA
ncbi:dTDP-4-dehydrorhamnose reductase [Pontimonas sp.]|nr:dTDP-4-dehydrorhamnose reductase [Pontimonas sp.]